MSFGIPSFSDIKNAVTNTVSSATSAATNVRDLGAAALDKTKELAADGVDLGRRAVEATRSFDVREAASVVRAKISEGTETARDGIKTSVEYAGRKTGEAADFARTQVPCSDNVVSNGIRGAITVAEDSTRFQLGVVGGVTREVVGLAGTVGQLGTTAAEMQLSPEARVEYGQKIVDGARRAAQATGSYVESAVRDPSRIGSDASNIADAGKQWAGGQVDRYQQAFSEGKGFETVGMDVGAVATYVVPVGGGPLRGALTAAARGGGEAAARGGTEAIVRGGTEAAIRDGSAATVRGAVETAPRGATNAVSLEVAESGGARFGLSASDNYRATFFAAHPGLEGRVVVHHAVEQQVLTRYTGIVSSAEMHSLENLRGIPKEVNSDLHLSQIRREWNQFYRQNASPTQEQLLIKATEIDTRYGTQFNPPVGR